MARTDANGDWIDPRGRSVPKTYIKPIDRARDAVVEKIVKDMLLLEQRMIQLKAESLERLRKYIAKVEAENNAPREGKGNITLTNFSGDKQVEYSLNDILEFDERLQVAKSIIDECLTRWSADANPKLRVVVDQAFQVDKKGRIDTRAILKLKDLNIRDKQWKQAMELISQALRVVGTRKYLVARVRKTPHDKFKTVNLNFSSIGTADK